jgi:hypothetical protein
MSKQESNFSRPEMLGRTAGLALRRRVLAGIATMLMSASLILTSSVFAHNINLQAARDKAREYARSIRDSPGRNYVHYETSCVTAFPGHNHYVRCNLYFQNAEDKKLGNWTCTEKIEVYLNAHKKTLGGLVEAFGDPEMHVKQTSKKTC